MDVFSSGYYKEFVCDWVDNGPKGGRGLWTKIAKHLGVHSVTVSQIFKGPKHISAEQAFELCDFLGLADLERDYFVLLVQKDRAGSFKLKKYYEGKLLEIRNESLDLKKRLDQDRKLSEEEKAIFYSNWFYSGIRLSTDLSTINTVDQVAQRLNLPVHTVSQVVGFLLRNGLCAKEQGQLKMGPQRIHVGADSPLVTRHHLNWRQMAQSKMTNFDAMKDLYFTGPYSLSMDLMPKIRKKLVETVEEITKEVVKSKSETLACLNVDWFEF